MRISRSSSCLSISKARNLTARTSIISLRNSSHFGHSWYMNSCLLSLVTLWSIGLHVSLLVILLLNVKCSITHGGLSVTRVLSLYFRANLACSLHHYHLLLLINLCSLFVALVGAKSLRTRAIHNSGLWLYFNSTNNLGSLVTAHNAASENAISCWNRYLSLVPCMLPHAILRPNVHIRTTSLSSHSMEHNLSLFVSATLFIVHIYSHTILSNCSGIWLHVILILVCKLSNSLNTCGVLSSVTVFHLSHVLLASLFVNYLVSSSAFLLSDSLLKTAPGFWHLVSAHWSSFDVVTHVWIFSANAAMECCVSLDSILS